MYLPTAGVESVDYDNLSPSCSNASNCSSPDISILRSVWFNYVAGTTNYDAANELGSFSVTVTDYLDSDEIVSFNIG